MFKHEGSPFVDMALHARLFVLQGMSHHAGTGAHSRSRRIRAMWVVAVRALHEPLVYPMLDRHGKLGPDVRVATVAKVRLRFGKELLWGCCFVNRVAIGTNYIGGGVRTAPDISSAQLFRVALEASVECLFWSDLRKSNDLGLVAFGLNVSLAGTMATFQPFSSNFSFSSVVDLK